MIVNPFFSPVVRLQTEFGHRVIADGPYRFMRHPGYFAMLISIPASALAIGSFVALIPAIGFAWVIHQRTQIEDQFLKANLPGYRNIPSVSPPGCLLSGVPECPKSHPNRPPRRMRKHHRNWLRDKFLQRGGTQC